MKKIIQSLILLLFCTYFGTTYAQEIPFMLNEKLNSSELPFSNIIKMPLDSLKSVGFKYDKQKNLYTLKSLSKRSHRAYLWQGVKTRGEGDMDIYIYCGKTGKSIIQICFYDAMIYEGIKHWAEKYHNVYSQSAQYNELTEFKQDSLKIKLTRDIKRNVFFAKINMGVILNTIEDSNIFMPVMYFDTRRYPNTYRMYIMTVFTKEKLHSSWLVKQQKKAIEESKKQKDKKTKLTLQEAL